MERYEAKLVVIIGGTSGITRLRLRSVADAHI